MNYISILIQNSINLILDELTSFSRFHTDRKFQCKRPKRGRVSALENPMS